MTDDKKKPRSELVRRGSEDERSDFDRLFDDLWGRFTSNLGLLPLAGGWGRGPTVPTESGRRLRAAAADVVDDGKAFKVIAEVPGIPKDQIGIWVRGNSVEIRGEARTATKSDSKGYVHRERTYSGFYRAFELPEPVLASEAKAKVENGVLELELPKQHPTPAPAETKIRIE